ncbi:MAG TPA: hypothetical protein VJT33_15170 [bacterium]|nr:hypothetical protein [bacterium]
MLNVVRSALILMLALPAVAVAQAPPPASYVVTPGAAIGQWPLDGKVADFSWAMSDNNVVDVAVSGTELLFRRNLWEKSWQTPRIFILFVATSSTVLAVGSTEPGAQTADRVGIGSSEQDLTGVYQDPQLVFEVPLHARTLIYDNRGVAFEYQYVPAAGHWSAKANRVFVFRPGQARTIWQIP